MLDLIQNKNPNVWIAVDHGLAADLTLATYTQRLKCDHSPYGVIAESDMAHALLRSDFFITSEAV